MLYLDTFFPTGPDYDCSNKTRDEWLNTGYPRPLFGSIETFFSLFATLYYIPVLWSMCDRRLLKQPCYKLMFVNGCADLIALSIAGTVSGYGFAKGSVYCSDPELFAAAGRIGFGMWVISCCNCIVLSWNRLSLMSGKMSSLFEERVVYAWITFSLCAGFTAMFFTRPFLLNTHVGAWLFCPIIKDINQEQDHMTNPYHALTNIVTACILTVTYTILIICIVVEKVNNNISINYKTFMNKLFLQIVVICMSTVIASYVYLYMQYFPAPTWFYLSSSALYLWHLFLPCIVYSVLNNEIKNNLKELIARGILSNSYTVGPGVGSAYMGRNSQNQTQNK